MYFFVSSWTRLKMRYGLLSDGKRQPRKQWKLDMEAQVKLFKQILMTKEVEMRLCNSRLDDLLEKTTESKIIFCHVN